MAFKVKKVKPLFTGVITTARTYSEDVKTSSGLFIGNKMAGTMNPYQTIIAVGPMASGLKEGDVVCLNFDRYAKVKHTPGKIEDNIQKDNMSWVYEIPMVEIDGQKCLSIQNNDIVYVVEEYELDNDGGLFE